MLKAVIMNFGPVIILSKAFIENVTVLIENRTTFIKPVTGLIKSVTACITNDVPITSNVTASTTNVKAVTTLDVACGTMMTTFCKDSAHVIEDVVAASKLMKAALRNATHRARPASAGVRCDRGRGATPRG